MMALVIAQPVIPLAPVQFVRKEQSLCLQDYVPKINACFPDIFAGFLVRSAYEVVRTLHFFTKADLPADFPHPQSEAPFDQTSASHAKQRSDSHAICEAKFHWSLRCNHLDNGSRDLMTSWSLKGPQTIPTDYSRRIKMWGGVVGGIDCGDGARR